MQPFGLRERLKRSVIRLVLMAMRIPSQGMVGYDAIRSTNPRKPTVSSLTRPIPFQHLVVLYAALEILS